MAGPPRKAEDDKRKKISITIPKDLVAWLDEETRARAYPSRSYAVELCIRSAKEQQRSKK